MLVEKSDGVAPQFGSRALAIARPVIRQKGVPGILVDLDRRILSGGRGALLHFLRLRHRRVLVFLAEHREKRATELADEVEDRGWPRRRGLRVGGSAMDEPAPAIDSRVDLVTAAGKQQGLAPTRTEADRADLAAGARQRAQVRGCGFQILDRLRV